MGIAEPSIQVNFDAYTLPHPFVGGVYWTLVHYEDLTIMSRYLSFSPPFPRLLYSPWKRPLIRLYTHAEPVSSTSSSTSSHSSTPSSWHITFYVYFSRLIFELIADPDIQGLMSRLNPPGCVQPTAKLKEYPAIYTTSKCTVTTTATAAPVAPSSKNKKTKKRKNGSGGGGITNSSSSGSSSTSHNTNSDFTLPGVLRAAESVGYEVRDPPPHGLSVELFEYQRSTYQWMLDHERDEAGLNGYFWEAWEWADGSAEDAMYYFPLAGELRLFKPPHSTGGLLCEEMGLGKTVELLSVVLGEYTVVGVASSTSSILPPNEIISFGGKGDTA